MTTTLARPQATGRPTVDPRAPRFGAAITTVVLAVALVTLDRPLGAALLGWQALAFGLAAVGGLRLQPYGWIFRRAVRPRLGPPDHLEDAAPPRFAQAVGLAFALVGLLGLELGLVPLATAAVAMALAAAFLNAAFDFCLGCEMYLLGRRVLGAR